MTLSKLHADLQRNTAYRGGYVVDGIFNIRWHQNRPIPPLPARVNVANQTYGVKVALSGAATAEEPGDAPLSLKAALGAGAIVLLAGVGVVVASQLR